jgi:hypothetical protein
VRSECRKCAHRESGRGLPEREEYTAVFAYARRRKQLLHGRGVSGVFTGNLIIAAFANR